jgi:hypothetical protein
MAARGGGGAGSHAACDSAEQPPASAAAPVAHVRDVWVVATSAPRDAEAVRAAVLAAYDRFVVGARPGGVSNACQSLFVGVGNGCSAAAAGRGGAAPDVSGQDGAAAQVGCSEGASAPRPSQEGGGSEELQLVAVAPIGSVSATLVAPKWKGVSTVKCGTRDAAVASYCLSFKLGGRGSVYGGTYKDAPLAARLHDELHVARSGDVSAPRPNLEAARSCGCAARFPVLDPATTAVPWAAASSAAKAAFEKLLSAAQGEGEKRRVAGALRGVAEAVALAPRPKSKYKYVVAVLQRTLAWQSLVGFAGQQVYIGTFSEQVHAAIAADLFLLALGRPAVNAPLHAEAAEASTVAGVKAELPDVWHSKLALARGVLPAPALPLSGSKRKANNAVVELEDLRKQLRRANPGSSPQESSHSAQLSARTGGTWRTRTPSPCPPRKRGPPVAFTRVVPIAAPPSATASETRSVCLR